jgi:hypothetical protein
MAENCLLSIKAVPNAARSEVVGWLGEALKIRLKAPPVDGKANAELCRFLAAELGLPKTAVPLVSGVSTRQKRLEIKGCAMAALRERFPE